MNYFFPFSVVLSTVVACLLINKGLTAHRSFDQASFFVLGVLVSLALLELWFLVVPLSSTLWDWSLTKPSQDADKRLSVDLVAGFLGAGKTTAIRSLMMDPPAGERLMVLVNEFGEVGLDGARLAQDGTEVLELPNGCICCTMRGDLKIQILRLAKSYRVDRLVIEPSGVASAGELLLQLHDPALSGVLGQIRAVLVLDPQRFLDADPSVGRYMRTQVSAANVVVLNKADLSSDLQLTEVESAVHALAPHARVLRTQFGRIRWADLLEAPGESELRAHDQEHEHDEGHSHPEFDAVSEEYGGASFRLEALQGVLGAVQVGRYGTIWRTKGLIWTGSEWWQVDGTREQVVWQRVSEGSGSRMTVIGLSVRQDALREALLACQERVALLASVR